MDSQTITWEDLPYLVYKRSEQIGHQVRTYLTKKWGLEFVNTGIWNYVRYVMLAEVVLEGDGLPTDWKDQAAIFKQTRLWNDQTAQGHVTPSR